MNIACELTFGIFSMKRTAADKTKNRRKLKMDGLQSITLKDNKNLLLCFYYFYVCFLFYFILLFSSSFTLISSFESLFLLFTTWWNFIACVYARMFYKPLGMEWNRCTQKLSLFVVCSLALFHLNIFLRDFFLSVSLSLSKR